MKIANTLFSSSRLSALLLAFGLTTGACLLPLRAASDKYTDWNTLHTSGWGYRVKAGFVLGGTAPLPFPRSIRSIDGFTPYGSYSLEAEVERALTGRWGLVSGLRFTVEGMSTTARVKSYHMAIVDREGNRMEGYYTGMNKTRERMTVLTLPLLASYRVCPRWTLKAGPYMQWMLKRKFKGEVYNGYLREDTPTGEKDNFTKDSPATYDFSHDMRRFLVGAEVGADWQGTDQLSLFTHFDMGLNGVFHGGFRTIDFTMYPIFMTLGVAYHL